MTATTAQLDRLDAAYRRQQVATQAAAALAVARLWRSIRPESLDEDGPVWLERSVPIVLRGFDRSADVAQAYYGTLRHLQAPDAKPFVMPRIERPPIAQIKTSLWVTGVVGAQQRLNRLAEPSAPPTSNVVDLSSFFARQQGVMRAGYDDSVAEAMSTSGAAAAGATLRHVGNGGRAQVKEAVKVDVRAVGYVRVTSGSPCYFCAMLASRTNYKGDSFELSDPRFEGPGTAKVHDNCACTLRAVYSKNPAEVPELNQVFSKMWTERGDGDPLLAFRQLYEGRAA